MSLVKTFNQDGVLIGINGSKLNSPTAAEAVVDAVNSGVNPAAAPITGVAVTLEDVYAALVALGLIAP